MTQPQPKTRDQRARELSRMSKKALAAMCRDGIRTPDGGLVCVEGAYPVITWDKHDVINSILGIEYPAKPAPQAGDLVGRIVARAYDDAPGPLTGRVTGQVDEDRVEVAWADEQYSSDPRITTEWLDELRPVGRRPGENSLAGPARKARSTSAGAAYLTVR